MTSLGEITTYVIAAKGECKA